MMNECKEKIINLCLVSPLPPPYGGIGHWTLMMQEHAIERNDIKMHCVDTSPRWRAIDDLATWKRFVGGVLQLLRDIPRVLKQLRSRPDVLHLNTSGQLAFVRDLIVINLARMFRVPVVYALHFGRIPQIARARSWEWRLLVKAILLSHFVVTLDKCSEATIREHCPYTQIASVPNAVKLDALPVPVAKRQNVYTAAFLGWVIPSKGIDELVQAWAELQANGWRLVIVGPGNVSYQQQLLEKYNVHKIEFTGEKSHDEAMEILASSDLFILPSYTEGFPTVVLEAMALGKPIIASRVGAIPEMLTDECGVVVEPKDTAGLRDTMARLMVDGNLRQQLGANARQRASSQFSINAVFERYNSIWRRVAESRIR